MQQNTNFQVETAAWDLVKHDYLKIMEGDNRIGENNLNSLFCIFNRFRDPHTVGLLTPNPLLPNLLNTELAHKEFLG